MEPVFFPIEGPIPAMPIPCRATQYQTYLDLNKQTEKYPPPPPIFNFFQNKEGGTIAQVVNLCNSANIYCLYLLQMIKMFGLSPKY